jgi:hypothetical protein
MYFTCVYSSGREFGTSAVEPSCKTTIHELERDVNVSFDFQKSVKSKSKACASDASVKSLNIYLTKAEALKLAAALIAQANHPLLHGKKISWMPVGFMPSLPKENWEGLVRVTKSQNMIRLINMSCLLIGRVELKVTFNVKRRSSGTIGEKLKGFEEGMYSFTDWREVDLVPGQEVTISAKKIDGLARITAPGTIAKLFNVEVLNVTGMSVK